MDGDLYKVGVETPTTSLASESPATSVQWQSLGHDPVALWRPETSGQLELPTKLYDDNNNNNNITYLTYGKVLILSKRNLF